MKIPTRMPQADLLRLQQLQHDIQNRRCTILDALVQAWKIGDGSERAHVATLVINTQGTPVDETA